MSVENNKVSIIFPVYNVDKYLEKCINSALNQTYRNLELIFVDDGSKDDSGKILDKYAQIDNRIVVVHKENGGVSSARNTGLAFANGKYVCFCDPDDWLEDDYVETLVNLLCDDMYDIGITSSLFIGDSNKQRRIKSKIYSGIKACNEIYYSRIPIGVYSKIFLRKFLIDNKISFNVNYKMGEGLNFNIQAFSKTSKINVTTKNLYHYRVDNAYSACTYFSFDKCLNAILSLTESKELISNKVLKAWSSEMWATKFFCYTWMIKSNQVNTYIDFFKKLEIDLRKSSIKNIFSHCSFKYKLKSLLLFISPNLIKFILSKEN